MPRLRSRAAPQPLHRRPRAGLVVLALALGLHTPLGAQERWQFLPRHLHLPRPLAAPREPALGGKLVLSDGTTLFGPILEGEAMLGGAAPILARERASGGGDLLLGLEGGVFARFNMETLKKDLIASDWVFGVPVVLRRGPHWVRLRYRHQSAHLGDEYIQRFDVERIAYNRDAFDVLAYRRLSGAIGAYAGAAWALLAEPNNQNRWVTQGGIELEPPRGATRIGPYLALDVRVDQDAEWKPAVNAQLGVRLWTTDGHPDARIFLEVFVGPSPMGQFYRTHTTSVALGGTITR